MKPHRSTLPSPRALRRASFALTAGCACASLAYPQEFFGRWEDSPGVPASIEFLVSPAGDDTTGSGTAAQPWRSITKALTTAQLIWRDPGVVPPQPPVPVRITINAAPGLYDASFGEMFPLRVPSHALALETWPQLVAASTDRPVIDAGFTTAILCDWIGPETTPATVLQTLEIRNANPAILIDPSLQPFQMPSFPTVPSAVEVRQNYIHDCRPGISITTAPGYVSAHVVEDNDIGDDTPILNRAMLEVCSGVASTMYRSNRVQFYEEGVAVLGNGVDSTVPRIFSNFIQIGERLVNLTNCASFMINNTVAFAEDFTAVPVVNGVTAMGGTLQLHNNIIWCPVTPGLVPAIDVSGTAAIFQVTNLIEDVAGGLTPGFVGGDMHPGLAAVDLHLLSTSAMIGAGTNAMVVDPVDTVRAVPAGGMSARIDISVDNDLDGRLFLSGVEAGPTATVDIGGDEFLLVNDDGMPECRIIVPAMATQDRFGNILAQPINPTTPTLRTWLADLELHGPANGAFSLMLGYAYFDTTPDMGFPVLRPNGPIYQNLVGGPLAIFPSLGNVTVDLGLQTTVASGSFDASGTAVLSGFTLAVGIDQANQEAEMTFQLFTLDPATARLAASNRVKLELGERP